MFTNNSLSIIKYIFNF